MITAVFTDNSDYARATGLWQWDYGQRLRIDGLKLPTAVEIHFALTEQSGDAITRVGTTKDGVTEVVIPDSLLENQAAGATYEIYAWIYLADKTFGETIKRISMQVKRRPKPEEFDTPEDAELFREAIEAVNASADRAETAREGAEAAQKAAEAAAGKIEGEITGAGQIAEQVRQDADAVAKDKQAVSQMVTETTQNAQKAAKAAQAAERSSTAAKEAQAAAESAEAGAESAMEEVKRDRVEVSETHKAVEQLRGAVDTDRQAVAADRRAVENTALQFGQFAQSAINAVGQAQEAAVGAVSAEGQKQTTAVQQAGTQAVSEVTAAKTEAVQAVTAVGDTQTKRVQDAAAGIVADREQIAENKAEIASLRQSKADAIVETVAGEIVTAPDSSGAKLEGLRVFGKSTQIQTTGAQLFDPFEEEIVYNGVVITRNADASRIMVHGTATNSVSVPLSKRFKMRANTTYILKIDNKHMFDNIWVRITDSDGAIVGNYLWIGKNGNTVSKTTLPDNITNQMDCEIRASMIAEEKYDFQIDHLFLFEGSADKDWEPYSGGFSSPSTDWEQPIVNAGESGSITVEVTGRNLIDYTKAKGDADIQFVDGGFIVGGDERNRIISLPCNIQKGKSYTIDFKENHLLGNNNVSCYLPGGEYSVSGNAPQQYGIIKKRPFIANDDCTAFGIYYDIKTVSVSKSEVTDICLVKTGMDTSYEPYVEPQSLTLATPNGLPGVPVSKDGNYTDQNGQQWVCDEVDLGRGKYVQRVLLLKFDSNSPFDLQSINTNNIANFAYGLSKKSRSGSKGICNRLKQSAKLIANETNEGVHISESVIFIRLKTTRASTVEELKQFLANNPTDVLYQIATPIERDLTPEELAAYSSLHANCPTTVITNDAGAHMEATYVADTGKYIQNLEERLNAKLVNIQSALISQKISGGGYKGN